jgi:hypothetical protein
MTVEVLMIAIGVCGGHAHPVKHTWHSALDMDIVLTME